MRYPNSIARADEGVAAVSYKVARELKWIFRPVDKADVGIDAIVEVCRAEIAQSRLISLQIKSGRSYFSELSKAGFIYRSDKRHLEYFLNHSLPVILAFYDPDSAQVTWQQVTPSTIHETKSGWSIVIPYENVLNSRTASKWSKIATKHDLEKDKNLNALNPGIVALDGSLAPLFEILQRAGTAIEAASPFISIELLSLLDFIASKIPVRVLISETALDQPWIRDGMRPVNVAVRVVGQLHSKFIIVDHRELFIGSANLTSHGFRNKNEVLVSNNQEHIVHDCFQRFREMWQGGHPLTGDSKIVR